MDLAGLSLFRKKYRVYSEELKTQRPKPYGMVERVARSGRLIVDGHHDLEMDLRNESGKVEHKTLWVSRIPPASFFFRKFNMAYNEGKWNSLGYARRWLRRHNHANSSMVEHSK